MTTSLRNGLKLPAVLRLEAARDAAAVWDTQLMYRETEKGHTLGPGVPQWHLCCSEDGQSLCCLFSGGTPIQTEPRFMTDRLVAHLLQCHLSVVERREEYNEQERIRKELKV
jgi:hypothetical protein